MLQDLWWESIECLGQRSAHLAFGAFRDKRCGVVGAAATCRRLVRADWGRSSPMAKQKWHRNFDAPSTP
eukprot:635833-Amphidinium_carterae.1